MTENSHQSGDLAQRKVRLGDLLVQTGLISEAQLQLALQEQKRTGSKLGRTVIDLGFVAEVKLLTALSEQLKIPFIELKHFKFDQNLVQTLPEAMARRFRAIPLSREGGGVLVGMSDPLDLFAQDEMERLLKTRVHPAVVREAELLATLDLVYRRTSEIASIAGELEGELQDSDFDLSKLGADNVSDAPVVRLLQTLFEDAVQMKASDIHIEPDEGVVRIRQRIDGVLNEQVMKEQRIASALVMRLKIMSGLDISEKRLPQDGRFNIRVKNRNIDVRVSTMPVQFGESVVMRLLDQSAGIASLDAGGMPADMLARFRRLLQRPYGMVLVTGPTGSGKTSTIYSCIHALKSPQVSIVTAEEPVEYVIDGVAQCSIDPKIDLTFEETLRHIVRQDPDVIVLDEPTSFLDVKYKLELLSILERMARQKKITVIMSLHEIDLAQKISDKIICVKGETISHYGSPEEVFTEEIIRELYGINNGYFDPLFGSIELPAPEGEPEVFVISSGGTGIPVYRRLQKEHIPFAAGILYENDMDYRLARLLAAEVITEEPFEEIREETLQKAFETMGKCKRVINAGVKIGTWNIGIERLLERAEIEGKL